MEKEEGIIYFPNKSKMEECLNELSIISTSIDLQAKDFSLENLENVKEIEKKLDRISSLSEQIRLTLSVKVKNPSSGFDEFITIPKIKTF